jgi:hypothetical protein
VLPFYVIEYFLIKIFLPFLYLKFSTFKLLFPQEVLNVLVGSLPCFEMAGIRVVKLEDSCRSLHHFPILVVFETPFSLIIPKAGQIFIKSFLLLQPPESLVEHFLGHLKGEGSEAIVEPTAAAEKLDFRQVVEHPERIP